MNFPIAYITYRGNRNITKLKRHSSFEISLVDGGTVQYYVGSRVYIGKKGDVFFIRPFDLHFSTSIDNAEFSLKIIEFEREIIFPDYLIQNRNFNFLKSPSLSINNKISSNSSTARNIVSLFKKIETFNKRETENFRLFLTGIAYLVIIELVKEFKNVDCVFGGLNKAQRYNLNKILEYIDNHYLEKISLKDLAPIACFHKNYLCNLFKSYTGSTVSHYIIRKRLEHAIFLLNSTDLSIAQVIYESGFDNISYFYRCFKKYIKLCPSFFRKDIN